MNNYKIVLYDKKNETIDTQIRKVITFADAARDAYLIRNKKGFDWEILSIVKIEVIPN